MLEFKFIILMSILIKCSLRVESCNFFESKKYCDCGLVYSIGSNEPTKLFNLASIEDCGINLTCNENGNGNCAERCLNSIRKVLDGVSEFDVTSKAKNKICELVAPQNQSIFRNGVTVWASWSYSGCGNGTELVVEDICCNRKCNCKIESQLVTRNLNETFENLVDLTSLLPTKPKAYECSLSELEDCQDGCMSLVSSYFDEPNIKYLNDSILNYNIFYREYASEKTCKNLLNKQISMPGIDIYASIDASSANFSIKYVSLGRLCCKPACECEYVFRDATDYNLFVRHNQKIESFQPSSNLAYECSDELENCMIECRKRALSILTISNVITTSDTSLPITVLQPLKKSEVYANNFCDLINNSTEHEFGFMIYLKYKNNYANSFPQEEDLHLGRVCCDRNSGITNAYIARVDCIKN